MKIITLSLITIALIGSACSTAPPTGPVSVSALPNCFDSNYSPADQVFTIRNPAGKVVNQQCILTVTPRGKVSPGQQLAAGNYLVSVSDGGGGGAGGTMHDGTKFPGVDHGGGGGGGGAGAAETQLKLNLTEGEYRITIGAGGPGGSACSGAPNYFGGGPGWFGSPTNIVRLATGEVVLGTAGAETYVRPSRSQNDKGGKARDGSGGSGPGQTTGGHGANVTPSSKTTHVATAGAETRSPSETEVGGAAGKVLPNDQKRDPGPGGGGGATNLGAGGAGGGDLPKHANISPKRGTLGSGGGGGAGDLYGCAAGASGGHGFVAFQPG